MNGSVMSPDAAGCIQIAWALLVRAAASCAGEAGPERCADATIFRAAPREGKPQFQGCEILPIACAQRRGLQQ